MEHVDAVAVGTGPNGLVGQMTTADPSRSPSGAESAWAYSHLPRGVTDDASAETLAYRMDEQMERFAPGFGGRVLSRVVRRPSDLERADADLVHGAVNGGTAQRHQQLLFRPIPGLSGSQTPVRRLFRASASAHPGGGVHGVCGLDTAREALAGTGLRGALRRRVRRTPTSVVWNANGRQ